MKKPTKKQIESSLMEQLDRKNIRTSYTIQMVEQYMDHYDTVAALTKTIKKDGVKVIEFDARGNEKTKTNPAIQTRQNEVKAMNSILTTLKLSEPVIEKYAEDDYL